jgi:hypothetical protein
MSKRGSSLVEAAPRLPNRIAAQVAWSSIKVRLSRSLVTVSSVVLAVAFLLVVLGGDIADHAVYGSYSTDDRPAADVRAIYDGMGQPREPLGLLELLAGDAEIASWSSELGVELPAYQPQAATKALALAAWVSRLKATDRFKALENQHLHMWLLGLDDPGAVDRFLTTVSTFRGVRLPFEAQEVHDLAGRTEALRAAVAAMQQAELARLERVAAAGGVDAVISGIRTGDIGRGDASRVGLPLSQTLGEIDAERLADLRAQLDRLALRDRARGVFEAVSRVTPEVSKVRLVDLQEGSVATRSQAFRQEFDQLVQPSVRNEVEASLREKPSLAPIIAALEGSAAIEDIADVRERADRIKRLTTSPEIQAYLLDLRLNQELSAEEQDLLRGELGERERLDALAETFKQAGFDPNGDGSRTFWLLVLSLLVCITGIVNSMMMAVTERFREIATMKCLGAMDGFILKAFLIESGSVGFVGAVCGALLGVLIVLLQGSVTYGGTFWNALPGGDLALAGLAALGCGILLTVFGALLPAYKAARMHPIEAMRLET